MAGIGKVNDIAIGILLLAAGIVEGGVISIKRSGQAGCILICGVIVTLAIARVLIIYIAVRVVEATVHRR